MEAFNKTAAMVLIGLLPLGVQASEKVREGVVLRVVSTDTIYVLDAKYHQVQFRLENVVAPKPFHPYGKVGAQELGRMLVGKKVVMRCPTTCQGFEAQGSASIDGQDIETTLLQHGLVWLSSKEGIDPKYVALESKARDSGFGVWEYHAKHNVHPARWSQHQAELNKGFLEKAYDKIVSISRDLMDQFKG